MARPGKRKIGSIVRIKISGDREGSTLLAMVERNSPEIVVRVTERDPIWHWCKLNMRQCKIVNERAKA